VFNRSIVVIDSLANGFLSNLFGELLFRQLVDLRAPAISRSAWGGARMECPS
jgi:hypothetical protein